MPDNTLPHIGPAIPMSDFEAALSEVSSLVAVMLRDYIEHGMTVENVSTFESNADKMRERSQAIASYTFSCRRLKKAHNR